MSWKRADDNALRAHLQEALSQRSATTDAGDWSYSDYDVAAIRAELDERQRAHDARQDRAESRLSGPQAGAECGARNEGSAAIDLEVARLRVLISRCFNPARRHAGQAAMDESDIREQPLPTRHRFDIKPTPVFARLQRLR
jgi:hypothetical protein